MMDAAIKLTSPNLSDSEFKKARSMMKQTYDIIEHCKNGSVKLTQQIVDLDRAIVFPIFSNDNLETIVDRYNRLYPIEATQMVKEFQAKIAGNESGWSKDGLLKLRCSVPATIYAACKALTPLNKEFWTEKEVKHFCNYCSKLSTKSREGRGK